MTKRNIPDNIKEQVNTIVTAFNHEVVKNPDYFYTTRYRGSYLYLSRNIFGMITQICRLKYTGTMDGWEFAIYKHSTERYDPDEWFFPGAGNVDGTVEGAMEAGLEAYP